MLYRLEGRRVLVTGAGSGIGRALAMGLAAEGAEVVAADIVGPNAEDVATAVSGQGGRAFGYQLDVTDAEACNRLAQQVARDHGPVQTVVNSAGIVRREKFGDDDFLEKWQATIDVNLHGVLHVTLAFLDQLKATRGTIVNIASTAATHAAISSSAYAASKAGVVQLTRVLARDLAEFGIRANAIAPSMLRTALTQAIWEDESKHARAAGRSMLKRIGEPEEMVGPVVFLASEMSSFVTGTLLYVDGGTTGQ